MFDVVGAIAGTAIYAVLVGVLVGFSPARLSTKLAAFAAAAAWGAIIVTITALGLSAPGAAGPVPVPVVAFLVLLVLLFGGWVALPTYRSALLSVPLPALVGVNAARLGGIFFLILTAGGRLSAPFGPAAGWGDILVGALAIPVAAVAASGAAKGRGWVSAWNVLGAVDLINAVSLGALSAPGTPIRVFTEGPGTLAMTTVPWIMVPAILVPLYFLIHFTIAAKLRSSNGYPRPYRWHAQRPKRDRPTAQDASTTLTRGRPEMRVLIITAQNLVRFTGSTLIVLGVFFWTGRALTLVPLHMRVGVVFVISLWALALLAARAGASRGLAGLTLLWGLVVPIVGMLQDRLVPGDAHWTIKTLHLLLGLGAMGLAERLAAGINRAPTSPLPSSKRGAETA